VIIREPYRLLYTHMRGASVLIMLDYVTVFRLLWLSPPIMRSTAIYMVLSLVQERENLLEVLTNEKSAFQ
jgi:hypothetical protein